MLLPLVGVMAICGCALATSVASDCRLFYSADVRWQPMLLQTAACCILRMCADSLCCFRLPLVVLCGCALATSVASDCRLYFADVCWQPLLLQTAACCILRMCAGNLCCFRLPLACVYRSDAPAHHYVCVQTALSLGIVC